jgi:hypothetical protein
MKRIFIIMLGAALIVPGTTLANSENLQFTFRYHCEKDDTECEEKSKIPEEEEYFFIPQTSSEIPIKVDLVIKNPKREMISSVRAKMKFTPLEAEITDLDTQDSDFPLAAPNENDIDEEEGTVMIGRSFTGQSRSDEEFFVGTIAIMTKKSGTKIEFLNYQDTELGDTGIFFTNGRTTENRLKEEPKGLQIGMEMDTSLEIDNDPAPLNPAIGGSDQIEPNPYTGQTISLPRPQDLRIQTDNEGNVRLIWPMDKEKDIAGYYLYYSQKSGYYLRRRDVGKTNFALFPNLPKGEKYFFAIKAYSPSDQESEYSNEVFVTVECPVVKVMDLLVIPALQKNSQQTKIPKNQQKK